MTNAPLPAGVVLAFDFGLRRIGSAAGDTLTGTAAPLEVLTARSGQPDWNRIAHLVREHGPLRLVVGTPYNEDGSEGALAQAASAFAAQLASRFDLPVERVDERYSSLEAAAELKARRASGARRRRLQRGDIDSLAAAILLTRWLRERTAG